MLALICPVLIEFDKSVIEYPSIKRCPGGASNDLRPIFSVRTILSRSSI